MSIARRLAQLARSLSRNDQIGFVSDFALSTPPPGWIFCDWRVLLEDTPYNLLRAKLLADGSPYGVDVNFNPRIPDARGRVSAGKDNMGGTAANRLTSAANTVNGAVLGASGGVQTHVLTEPQIPSHGHTATQPAHNHGFPANPSASEASGYGLFAGEGKGFTDRVYVTGGPTATQSGGGEGVSVQPTGGGLAHPNVQPTIVFNKIIYAGV